MASVKSGQVVDAHVHAVSDDVERYPRRFSGLGRDWWTGRAVDIDAVSRDLDGAGVGRAVVVQAVGAYGNDNRYARDAAATDPDRFAFVAALDPDGDDPAGELQALLADGPMAGVRVFGVHGEPRWLTDGRGAAIWEVAAEAGISIVPTLFPAHLDALAGLVARQPAVDVALDHCAFPDLSNGPPYEHASPLRALASLSSVNLKLTTIVLLDAANHGGAVPLVQTLVEWFGAGRVGWGSDHPQSLECSYPEMVHLVRDAASGLDDDDRHAVLGGTATRLWFGGR